MTQMFYCGLIILSNGGFGKEKMKKDGAQIRHRFQNQLYPY